MLREEGIEFITSTDVGQDVSIEDLRANADAVVLTLGSTVPRDLRIPNREAGGIHFAMEFLTKNQKRLMMTRDGKLESGWDRSFITAEGKDVIVVGGGDTGTVSRRAFPLLSLVVRGRVDTPILGRRQEGRTEQGELDATNPQRCSPPPPPGLHRHVDAAPLQVHRQLRAPSPAAQRARGQQPVAAVAQDLRHGLRPRRGPGKKQISQPTNQSTNPPISQSINQFINESIAHTRATLK